MVFNSEAEHVIYQCCNAVPALSVIRELSAMIFSSLSLAHDSIGSQCGF